MEGVENIQRRVVQNVINTKRAEGRGANAVAQVLANHSSDFSNEQPASRP